MKAAPAVAAILFLASALVSPAAPVMRAVKARTGSQPLLQNGDFELLKEGKLVRWTAWGQGYHVAPAEGRDNSQGITCERGEGATEWGASQTLSLDRTNISPFVIRGWSKARDVSGSPDSGYSLYVDIIYADGTSLWAQTANFTCGTHNWEPRELVLLPDKPVKSFTLHCLFRGHTGKVWFDDVSVEEVPTPAGAVLFQGAPLEPIPEPNVRTVGKPRKLATADGLKLALHENAITSIQLAGRECRGSAPSGFLVRDVAANSDLYSFDRGACADLGLKIEARFIATNNHIAVEGRVSDTTGRDRAITLLFALPIDATGWQWGDDARTSRRMEGKAEFCNAIQLRSGANGKMSLYPLAAVWKDDKTSGSGLALGLDMAHPAQYRLVYHAGTRQFFIAYDFGLAPESEPFPSSADFRFVIYRFDPRWGFRAALQKYYELFPQHFVKRVTREGVWMPFTDIAAVPRSENFGFAFQEGGSNVPFDDHHDIASFVYVEPMSHWLPMPPTAPRTYESALDILRKDLAGARGREKAEMAAATLTSSIAVSDGRFFLYLVKCPWCDGGVFSLNPDPAIPTTPRQPFNKAMVMSNAIAQAFAKNPGTTASGSPWPPAPGLDGVYLDSLEMSSGELNYRREHFRTASVPLVFDRDGRPCQLMIFNTWKYERDLAKQLHSRGKLLFANAVLWQFSFPAPPLDILGTEVNWQPRGEYQPDSDATMNFRRALCRQKPYCLLMNTDYSRFTPELVEHYFQRCLFYGIWPGFFDQEAASKDPYWCSSKKWYERDRPLFQQYIPLLRRITTAGWQPLTYARCSNPEILLERFGPGRDGSVYLTLLNNSPHSQNGRIELDHAALKLARKPKAVRLVSNEPLASSASGYAISLRPHQAEVICFSRD